MISGPTSYRPTLNEFLHHWEVANGEPGAGTGLVTRDGKVRADLVVLRAALQVAGEKVQEMLAEKDYGRAVLEEGKRVALGHAQELGRRLRGILPQDSPFLQAVPALPALTAGEEKMVRPLRDLVNLWARVEAAGHVFELGNELTRLDFKAEVAAVVGHYEAQAVAVLDLKLARVRRNQLQVEARAILSAYRPAVEAFFALESPLVLTIPLLYPPAGHTPEAVTATVTYDAAAEVAVITFTESGDEDLDHYQVRGVPGPEYVGDDEVVVATIPKEAAREVRTGYSLPAGGSQASFKVFVVLTTGNEAGSKPVTVARP
ncbi:MAG: hypothetical protein V4689_01795 [Verrucomicrobiota bacterium]